MPKKEILGLTILIVVIAGLTYLLTTAGHHKEQLRDTMVQPHKVWIDRYGDGIDSRQAFAIASIIEAMRKAKAELEAK